MDQILTDAYYNFGSFWDKHLFGTPGTSPFNLFHDRSLWDWSQLISPSTFVWKTGVTPFSDLETIRWSWVFYFFAILSLRRFMLDRSPKDIKTITAVHNLILLVGSILMFLGGVVGIYYAYMQGGWSNVFVMDKKSQKGIMFYSLYVFYLSKFYELLDTIILVLKKVTGFKIEGIDIFACLSPYYCYPDGLGMACWQPQFCSHWTVLQFIRTHFHVLLLFCFKSWIQCLVQSTFKLTRNTLPPSKSCSSLGHSLS